MGFQVQMCRAGLSYKVEAFDEMFLPCYNILKITFRPQRRGRMPLQSLIQQNKLDEPTVIAARFI